MRRQLFSLWMVLFFSSQAPELSAHVRLHYAADRITAVAHTGPGMDVTPLYDANGNVTQMVQVVQTQAGAISFTNRYEYDFDNRLVAVVSPVLVAQYVYDGLGNLLQITEAGTVRRLVRDRADGLTRTLAEMSGSNTLVRSYLWANGSLIAQVEAGGAVRYAHFNELGHLLALTDGSGNVTDEFSYHPYGRLVARTGTSETRFGYMGASGVMRSGYDLYLARHRAYSGNLMRFLGRDPAGLAGGANLYLYAAGNPVLFIDPLGLEPQLANYWETGSYWGDVGQVFAGYGDTVVNTAQSLYHIATRPVQTAQSLATAAMHPGATWNAIVSDYNTRSQSLRGQGSIMGEALLVAGSIGGGTTVASGSRITQVNQGTKVFRVWGDEAGAYGRSWTAVDPRTVPNYRNSAGLPSQNTGRYLSEGIIQDTAGIKLKPADPLHGNVGGLPEIIIPNPAQQIKLQNVQGLNPQF